MIYQDTNINIRISKKLRDKFIEVSKQNGLSYSMIVRNLIKDYIEKESCKEESSMGGIL